MKKTAAILLSSALLLSPTLLSSQVEASTVNGNSTNVNVLVPNEPSFGTPGGIQPYGKNPPSSDASTHNISVSAYEYQIQKVGFAVYTDKFIKGKTSMKVTVLNFKKELNKVPEDGLTISVYNASDNKLVESKKVALSTSNSVSFSGLKASTKYYVKFAVINNGNTYSFNGKIL